MEILLWLVPPVVVTILTAGWVAWAERRAARGQTRTEVDQARFAAAVQRPLAERGRRPRAVRAPARPVVDCPLSGPQYLWQDRHPAPHRTDAMISLRPALLLALRSRTLTHRIAVGWQWLVGLHVSFGSDDDSKPDSRGPADRERRMRNPSS